MKIHREIIQKSDEWWNLRKKRMGASNAQAIGNCGAGLKTYIKEIMCYYCSRSPEEGFRDKNTDRGTALEDSAGVVYSFEKEVSVEKIGYVEYNDYVGCSPDLFVEEDGLCEIKCLGDKGHFNLLLGGSFDSKYVWQTQMQMLICEKKWCDLISYNPNFDDYLFCSRQTPDKEKFSNLMVGFKMGEKMIREIEDKLNKRGGRTAELPQMLL